MLTVVFLAGYLPGLANEIEMYGKSALSSLYYVSNIFFYTQNDYFAPDLKHNPLLHTWSLSTDSDLIIGAVLIIVSLFYFSEETQFPSVNAI